VSRLTPTLAIALLLIAASSVLAGGAPCPATIASGSDSVMVDGKQAARAGDATGCGSAVIEGSPDVFINGKPMAAAGDAAGCAGQ
jgi:uncharacterized Zn-binding protein involved in type VI secretion